MLINLTMYLLSFYYACISSCVAKIKNKIDKIFDTITKRVKDQ